MVERDLAMVDVASSTLVSRSICFLILFISVARMAELVDARDLKSLGIFSSVPVQVRLRAPPRFLSWHGDMAKW